MQSYWFFNQYLIFFFFGVFPFQCHLQISNTQNIFFWKRKKSLMYYMLYIIVKSLCKKCTCLFTEILKSVFLLYYFYGLWVTDMNKLARIIAKEAFILQTNSDKWMFSSLVEKTQIWGNTLPHPHWFPMDKALVAPNKKGKVFVKRKQSVTKVWLLLFLACQYLRIVIPCGRKFKIWKLFNYQNLQIWYHQELVFYIY